MAERRKPPEDPFQAMGFGVFEDDDGEKRLVFEGKSLTLSELDLDNKAGIRIVLPNGRSKTFKGVHRYTINAKKFTIKGDFNL